MKKTSKAIYKIFSILALIFLIILAGLSFWILKGNLTVQKMRIAKILPIPVALVNNQPIFMKEFSRRMEIVKKHNDLKTNQQILGDIIKEKEISLIASNAGIEAKKADLDEELKFFKLNYEKENNQSLSEKLAREGLNMAEFEELIFKPQLLLTKLNIWYNNQKELNSESFKKIAFLQAEIAQKKDFGQLASFYTDETAQRQVEGDLGFVEYAELLPEIKQSLQNANEGEIKLIISRYGAHLIKIEEIADSPLPESKRMHLRQIFIEMDGFGAWLENQIQYFKIKNIIRV